MRVIATLTTTPHRQKRGLIRTLKALTNSGLIDHVWVQLPKTFRRDPSLAYAPITFEHPKLTVHSVEDVGPATKLVGAASMPGLRDDDVVIVTDDDIVLNDKAIRRLITACQACPDYVQTQMGGIIEPSGKHLEACMASRDGVGTIVDYFVAATGVAIAGKHLVGKGRDMANFVERCAAADPEALLCDDLVLANYFAQQHVPVVAIDISISAKGRSSKLIGVNFIPDDEHALSSGASGQARAPLDRQYGCVKGNLERSGLWFIESD